VSIGRPPVPSHDGGEVLNLGEDNGNVECVLHSSSVHSIAFQYARLDYPHEATSSSRETRYHTPWRDNATLDIHFKKNLRQLSAVWSGIKIPAVGLCRYDREIPAGSWCHCVPSTCRG
jgi:hypothetical protein